LLKNFDVKSDGITLPLLTLTTISLVDRLFLPQSFPLGEFKIWPFSTRIIFYEQGYCAWKKTIEIKNEFYEIFLDEKLAFILNPQSEIRYRR